MRTCVCVCAGPPSNLQFIILQFTIYALNFNFFPLLLLLPFTPLSTVIIMFHFAIQVFALRQVLLSQVRESERAVGQHWQGSTFRAALALALGLVCFGVEL